MKTWLEDDPPRYGDPPYQVAWSSDLRYNEVIKSENQASQLQGQESKEYQYTAVLR